MSAVHTAPSRSVALRMLPKEQGLRSGPLWERPQFADAVLGSSGASLSAESPPARLEPSGCSVASLVDTLSLLSLQLSSLFETTRSPEVKQAASRVQQSIKRCSELCNHVASVKDNESFYSLLSPFVARIKALEPGQLAITPAGWKGGLVMLVLHCDAMDVFTLAVVSSGDGLDYHPRRADPSSGETQYNSPLLLRNIPGARVQDSAVWFVLLKAGLFVDERFSAQQFYQQLLPYFNQRRALHPHPMAFPTNAPAVPTPLPHHAPSTPTPVLLPRDDDMHKQVACACARSVSLISDQPVTSHLPLSHPHPLSTHACGTHPPTSGTGAGPSSPTSTRPLLPRPLRAQPTGCPHRWDAIPKGTVSCRSWPPPPSTWPLPSTDPPSAAG